jgi:hypothetical protein
LDMKCAPKRLCRQLVALFLFTFFFFALLRFELRASHLLDRCST